MIPGAIQFNGDTLQASKVGFINRTGAALVKGGVYALDLTKGATESTTARAGAYNLVAVATAHLAAGILVVAEAATPDDEEGQGVIFGPAKVLVEGTTDVAAGDRLKAVNAQNYLQKASAAVGSIDVGVGVARDAQAANSAVLTDVFFDGITFNKVINAAVS